MRFTLLACLTLVWSSSAVLAQGALTPKVRAELLATTRQLGELMRQNVETIVVDEKHFTKVPLTSTVYPDTVYNSDGVVVPIFIEGVDGGNSSQESVALFKISDPDEEKLEAFGYADNPHKHVGLLAFTQLDNRGPLDPDWDQAVAAPGAIAVPVTTYNCNDRHGIMTIHANDNWFGPKLSISFDAGATLGPRGCLRP